MDRTSDFGSDDEGSNPSATTFKTQSFVQQSVGFFMQFIKQRKSFCRNIFANILIKFILNLQKEISMENVFDAQVAQNYIKRIQNLKADSIGKWGKMNVAEMLAHCNVTYEFVYEPEKHKRPGAIAKFILKTFVKKKVTGEATYSQNSPTAPQFLIKDDRDFEVEKKRLIGFIQKTQQLGPEAFDGKESFSFGKLNATEWNNMFAKHLNHHLQQFNV